MESAFACKPDYHTWALHDFDHAQFAALSRSLLNQLQLTNPFRGLVYCAVRSWHLKSVVLIMSPSPTRYSLPNLARQSLGNTPRTRKLQPTCVKQRSSGACNGCNAHVHEFASMHHIQYVRARNRALTSPMTCQPIHCAPNAMHLRSSWA